MQAFRGTSVEQDGRWSKIDQKLFEKMSKAGKFSPVLDTKVDLKKVNFDIIGKWITESITKETGFEDDILVNMVLNTLQSTEVDPKRMQITITPFLNEKAPNFVEALWKLLIDANSQPNGVPSTLQPKQPPNNSSIASSKTDFENKDRSHKDADFSRKQNNGERSASTIVVDSHRNNQREFKRDNSRRRKERSRSRERSRERSPPRRESPSPPTTRRTRRIGSSEERESSPPRRRNRSRSGDRNYAKKMDRSNRRSASPRRRKRTDSPPVRSRSTRYSSDRSNSSGSKSSV